MTKWQTPKRLDLRSSAIRPNTAARPDEKQITPAVKAWMDNVLVPAMVKQWFAAGPEGYSVNSSAEPNKAEQRSRLPCALRCQNFRNSVLRKSYNPAECITPDPGAVGSGFKSSMRLPSLNFQIFRRTYFWHRYHR